MKRKHTLLLSAGMLALGTLVQTPLATQPTSPSSQGNWDFEEVAVGGLPAGVEVAQGSWEIRELPDAPLGPKILVQTARNRGATFNVAVFTQPQLKDLDASVQLKALEGREDQGGGLVWRYQGLGNYYIARANPLESNFRVYKVVNGRRLTLQSAALSIAPGWHTLRVTMRGNQMECFFDGKSYLKLADDTLFGAGHIGLWTKADAVTAFDDLRVKPLEGGGR